MTTKSLFPPDCRLKLITYVPLAIAILLVLFVQPSLATGAPAPDTRPADIPAIAPPPFISIAAGRGTCAVTATGGVLCWGYGHPFPFYIRGLDTGIKSVAIGPNHTCALTVTGGVKCWGQNNVGQLGDGTTIDRSTPVDVVGLDDGVQFITVGYDHTCALTAGGGVMCWGQNETGQLGDGTTTQRTTPVDVVGLTRGVQTIAAGGTTEQISIKPTSVKTYGHTCAVTTGGGVRCWGANDYRQLGNDTMPEVHTPIDVAGLTSGVQAIAAGSSHTCALTTNGGVKCWGANSLGQLGTGASMYRASPADVVGLTQGVLALAAGGVQSCALTTGGAVKCWGLYPGDGSVSTSNSPVQVSGATGGFLAIAVGEAHACALAATGGVKCWGWNQSGQLGNYMTSSGWLAPTTLTYLEADVHAVEAGESHTCALQAGSSATGWGAVCWGYNVFGQLGDGGSVDRVVPRAVTGLDSGIQQLSAGSLHTCALNTDGGVSCWGQNVFGQLGDGTTEYERLTPVAVSGLSGGVTAISAGDVHTCALLSGAVRCWGRNEGGQVGDGTTENRYTPVEVAVGTNVQAISAGGSYTCALTDSGQVKCWGAYKTSVPVTVNLGGQAAKAVVVGSMYACALTNGGGVKCWGSNYFGQLGDGTTTDRPEPIDVVGLSSGVAAIAACGARTCAVLTGGPLVCWGGSVEDRLTPAPVPGLAGPVQAVILGGDHACALVQAPASPQPIWQCWGSNRSGQLGVNNGWLPVEVVVPDAWGYLPYAGRE